MAHCCSIRAGGGTETWGRGSARMPSLTWACLHYGICVRPFGPTPTEQWNTPNFRHLRKTVARGTSRAEHRPRNSGFRDLFRGAGLAYLEDGNDFCGAKTPDPSDRVGRNGHMRDQTSRNRNRMAEASPVDLAEDDETPGGVRGQFLLTWPRTQPSEG